jgi:hypothetical protein
MKVKHRLVIVFFCSLSDNKGTTSDMTHVNQLEEIEEDEDEFFVYCVFFFLERTGVVKPLYHVYTHVLYFGSSSLLIVAQESWEAYLVS